MSRTGRASAAQANGVYVVSATSAPPSIQYGIGVQASSGIASISRRRPRWIRTVMEKRTLIAQHTFTTSAA